MSVRRIVVVGASSGGVEALRVLVSTLPADLPAAICVVIHVAPNAPGIMPEVLRRAGRLPSVAAATGMKIEHGHIYVAPPDHHLIVEPGTLRISRGPKENRARPAIDPLFRSAAAVYGPAAIGVILTGDRDDGTSGLWTVKQLGGVAIVQDPADALHPSMPTSASQHVAVDYSVPIDQIGPLLVRLARAPVEAREGQDMREDIAIETEIAGGANAMEAGVKQLGSPSSFACPECHGVLLRLRDQHPLRFRCHTGHAYSIQSLIGGVDAAVGEAVWNAYRAVEEKRILLDWLAGHLKAEHPETASRVHMHAADIQRHAEALRAVAVAHGDGGDESIPG